MLTGPTSSGPDDKALAFLFRFTSAFLVPVTSRSGEHGFDPADPLFILLLALFSSFLGNWSFSFSSDFSLTHVSSLLLTNTWSKIELQTRRPPLNVVSSRV